MEYFLFQIIYAISTSAGWSVRVVGVGKCWQVKVAGERVFMNNLECMGDVGMGC